MRTLLGLVCLIAGSSAQAQRASDGPSRMDQVQAVLVEIAEEGGRDRPAFDLPDGLKQVVEAWSERRERS